jgi:hypothetical protein
MCQLVGRTGFSPQFMRNPSPSFAASGCDISDNGLPSWMDVNVLDADNLLPAFAAFAVQRREQLDERAGRIGGRLAQPLCSFERLFVKHRPAAAFHRCVVRCHRLGGNHALDLVGGLNARRPVTATKSCRLRSSSDWPRENQPVLVIESIRALLNRSLCDPPMVRKVSGSDSPRRITTGLGLGVAVVSDFRAMSSICRAPVIGPGFNLVALPSG